MLKASLCKEEGLPRKGSHFHLATEGSHRRSGYSSIIFKLFLSPSRRMIWRQSNPLPIVNFRRSRSSIWFHCCQLHLVLSIRSLRTQTKECISDFRTSVPTSAAKRAVTTYWTRFVTSTLPMLMCEVTHFYNHTLCSRWLRVLWGLACETTALPIALSSGNVAMAAVRGLPYAEISHVRLISTFYSTLTTQAYYQLHYRLYSLLQFNGIIKYPNYQQ
jgi:hypothetical protein